MGSAEVLASVDIGSRTAVELQWHQPLEPGQRWFAQLDAGVSSSPRGPRARWKPISVAA